MDPHHNLFFYYTGASRSGGRPERQAEDNTTKALINMLELSADRDSPDLILRPFLEWIGVAVRDVGNSRFALQRAGIPESALTKARSRLLLGIAPVVSSQLDEDTSPVGGSRPDAWIWGPGYVVCIETKVVGTFSESQMARHAQTLGTGLRQKRLAWKDVYSFFSQCRTELDRENALSVSRLLITQFLDYLRIIAYRQEIDMAEFDGFRPEHFQAFTFLDEEYADDSRRQVKHHLGTFVDALRRALPESMREFGVKRVGNLRADARHVWATLSRTDSPVGEPHLSFGVWPDAFHVLLLLEGKEPTTRAQRRIEAEPDEFLRILKKLPDWALWLGPRWKVGTRQFEAGEACTIQLEWAQSTDVDYLIKKMRDLREMSQGRGLFMLQVFQRYEIDADGLGSRRFVEIASNAVGELRQLIVFLS